MGFPPYFDVETLYDRDYLGNDWSNDEIKTKINNGLHIINFDGHANTWIVMKMWSENEFNPFNDVGDLNNTDYFFAYTTGCEAGAFDNWLEQSQNFYLYDCVLEKFVTSAYGAFAAIGSARLTWSLLTTDSSTQRLEREFWDAVFGEGKLHLGEANQDSKWDNIGYIGAYDGAMRWDYYAFNLLGDPETSINIPAHDTDILIVDDDVSEKYEKYYMNALHANGYNWDCCLPPADASVLLQYPVVTWFTGDDMMPMDTLSANDQANLQTYLDSGGRLFISGQDIGTDIGGSWFHKNYLHADFMWWSNIYTLNGVTGDPIGDGLTIGITGGDGADNQDWQCKIAPYDGNASVVFNYAGDDCGAIKADTCTYKVVYFGFGYE